MAWYYVEQGNQTGPYELDAFQELISNGTISSDTLVYGPDMADWISLADAQGQGLIPKPEPVQQPTPAAEERPDISLADSIACPNCGARVSSSNLIPLEGRQVCPNCRDLALQQIREGVGLDALNANTDYAGFGMRFVGSIVDGIIMQIYSVILNMFFGIGYADNPYMEMSSVPLILFFILSYAGPITYVLYFMGHEKFQATPGMMAAKIKIIRPDGERVGRWRIFGRYLGSIVSGAILCIGYLMMLWDDENRTLHDRWADTRVVNR